MTKTMKINNIKCLVEFDQMNVRTVYKDEEFSTENTLAAYGYIWESTSSGVKYVLSNADGLQISIYKADLI